MLEMVRCFGVCYSSKIRNCINIFLHYNSHGFLGHKNKFLFGFSFVWEAFIVVVVVFKDVYVSSESQTKFRKSGGNDYTYRSFVDIDFDMHSCSLAAPQTWQKVSLHRVRKEIFDVFAQ